MAKIEGSNLIFRITIFVTVMMQISMATHILVSVPALFLFGDSVLDAGTNNYIHNSLARANFPPYGETYFHRPTGRWSDGRNIGDFIAQYLRLPLAKPYLEPCADHKYGANFASGGSGLRDLTSSSSGVIPFKTQIRQFRNLTRRFNYDHISRSIFLMSTGNNDNREYLSNSTLQQMFTASEFVKCIMEIYETGLLALYKDGARKFVLIETGPAGCAPKGRLDARNQNETGCLTEGNQLSLIFDAALSNLTTKLTATLQDATFLHAKVFNLSQELINNGPKYGLTNTTNACCGAGPFNAAIKCGTTRNSTTCHCPSQYFFWDLMHPTEATNRIISKALWHGNTSYIEPFNIHTLATSISSNSFVAR